MDKDRFRLDLDDQIKGYQYIAERLGLVPPGGIFEGGDVNESITDKLTHIENRFSNERKMKELNPNKPRKV